MENTKVQLQVEPVFFQEKIRCALVRSKYCPEKQSFKQENGS